MSLDDGRLWCACLACVRAVLLLLRLRRRGVCCSLRLSSVVSSGGVVQHLQVDRILRKVDVANDTAADEAVVDRGLQGGQTEGEGVG